MHVRARRNFGAVAGVIAANGSFLRGIIVAGASFCVADAVGIVIAFYRASTLMVAEAARRSCIASGAVGLVFRHMTGIDLAAPRVESAETLRKNSADGFEDAERKLDSAMKVMQSGPTSRGLRETLARFAKLQLLRQIRRLAMIEFRRVIAKDGSIDLTEAARVLVRKADDVIPNHLTSRVRNLTVLVVLLLIVLIPCAGYAVRCWAV